MVQRLARGHESPAGEILALAGVPCAGRRPDTALRPSVSFGVCSTNRGTARGSVFSVGAAKGRALEARLLRAALPQPRSRRMALHRKAKAILEAARSP